MKGLGNVEKYLVTFTMENEKGNYRQSDEECGSMVSVARMLLTFKPKNGWEIFQIDVVKVKVLV